MVRLKDRSKYNIYQRYNIYYINFKIYKVFFEVRYNFDRNIKYCYIIDTPILIPNLIGLLNLNTNSLHNEKP